MKVCPVPRSPWICLAAIALCSGLGACDRIAQPAWLNTVPQPSLGSAPPITADNTWAFEPEADTYSHDALLDLRGLNEAVAGETGFIRRSSNGQDFVTGAGSPIRFWAVNSDVWSRSPQDLSNHAKFLAKRGVNLVRWHGNIPAQAEGAAWGAIDEQQRDQLWQHVAAMKHEGIYTTLSPYYPLRLKPQDHWPSPRSSEDMQGLLFFDPAMQTAYQSWLRQLLEPVNPYTGIALKDDPAIAIIQLQNEDSLLFWTFNRVRGDDLAQLKQQFGQWLEVKYGSLDQALQAWDNVRWVSDKRPDTNDQFAVGQVGLYPLWELTKDPEQTSMGRGKRQRLADQTEFLTHTMRQFNQTMVQFLREDIGTTALINAGNWKTVNPERLNDAERYSYTVGDVIGVNRYYGTNHDGPRAGWAVVAGDRFTHESVLTRPDAFPLNLKQVASYPMIISESSWTPPLSYQSEGPFLVSSFQSLTGIDAVYWFTTGSAQWRQPSSANGYISSLGKWVINTPELLGNFPAAALAYRQGYIAPGPPVVQEQRSLPDLWQRRSPLVAETRSFDPNRDRTAAPSSAIPSHPAHPLSFLVGPVTVTYGEHATPSVVESPQSLADPSTLTPSPFIDEQQQQVTSVTGEITWDYGKGLAWVNTPKAQGVTGFLNRKGAIELADVTLTANNHYGSLWVVSLDGNAIAHSDRILVQVGTQARSTGWSEQAITWTDDAEQTHQGFEILNHGQAPWRVVNTDMQLAIATPTLTQAIALDMNGMAREQIPLTPSPTGVSLTLPPDAKYIILNNPSPARRGR